MSVALISSLYQSEPHLPTFAAAVFGFAKQVSAAGIEVHYLPIVNDASDREREAIDRLARAINGGYHGRMTPQFVARESLYASWNRGLALSQSAYFASWNADDLRSAAAFIAGCEALDAGADLVDFPFTRLSASRRFGILKRESRQWRDCLFQPGRFRRGNGLGPFYMARRSLAQRVGVFDENFRIAGDMEWASRVKDHARFVDGGQSGGDFVLHGGNLSNSGSDREDIEVNIIFLRLGDYTQLVPAHPRAQLDAWNSWGNIHRVSLPAAVADYLWGVEAHDRWLRYRRERRQGKRRRRLRLAMASRGWLDSVEWATYLRSRDDLA